MLDLHGIKHKDVQILVEEYIYTLSNQNAHFTTYILTGNSQKMRQLVKEELDRHEWINYMDDLKPGRIFVCGM